MAEHMTQSISAVGMMVGDAVEFDSDRQTEKGPSSGRVVVRWGSQVSISHSDTVEWFEVADLVVSRVSTHHRGGKLWILR